MAIWDVIAGPVKDLVGEVGKIIDDVSTTDEERNAAKAKLEQIAQQAQSRLLEHVENFVSAQRDVIVAEAESEHWLASNWRPLVMLVFAFVILYAAMGPAFGAPSVDFSAIPGRFWTLLTVGIGGYIGGRSAEKIVPRWANAKYGNRGDGDE